MNEIKRLFIKYQKPLLRLINKTSKEKIIRIAPNFYDVQVGRNLFKRVVSCGMDYAEKFAYDLIKFDLLGVSDFKELGSYLGIMLATDNWNATTGSGYVESASNSSWSTVRGATTGTATNGGVIAYVTASLSGSNYYIDRAFLQFNPSLAGATISAATLYVYSYSAATGNVHTKYLDDSTAGDNTALVAEDMDSTTFATCSDNTITGNGNLGTELSWTLNTNGKSKIGTYAKYCVVDYYDHLNSAPSGPDSYWGFCGSNHATSSYRPKLSITYTPAAGGAFLFNMI